MTILRFILICAFLCFSINTHADNGKQGKLDPTKKKQLTTFFDSYLDVYNRRFGRPDQSESFRAEIVELVHFPVMQSPPKGAPMMIDDPEKFAKNFEYFVSFLEKKGVTKLQWHSLQLHPLTDNKVLANNIGHGVNNEGEVLYETVSLYLLYQAESRWRIALFSPYAIPNAIDLK